MLAQSIRSEVVARCNAIVSRDLQVHRGNKFGFMLIDPLQFDSSFEGRAGRGFLSDFHEQVCKLNLGRFHPPPHSWRCDWSVSWLLEIIGEAHIWQELLLFLLSLYCPATAFTSKEALLRGSCSKCVSFKNNNYFFYIIFFMLVLVHNHISSSTDRLFCLIFCCYCTCAVSGFLIPWYGCRDQSVMLPVLESVHTHLLFGCYLFATNAKTHTCTHTHRAAPGALSCPHYYSHITHSLFPAPTRRRFFFASS